MTGRHAGGRLGNAVVDYLAEHRGSLVAIGAQAVYLRAGAIDLPLADGN